MEDEKQLKNWKQSKERILSQTYITPNDILLLCSPPGKKISISKAREIARNLALEQVKKGYYDINKLSSESKKVYEYKISTDFFRKKMNI